MKKSKRFLAVALCALTLGTMGSSASALTAQGKFVNMRKTATKKAVVLCYVKGGDSVDFAGETKTGWTKVSGYGYKTSKLTGSQIYRTGWCMSEFLK